MKNALAPALPAQAGAIAADPELTPKQQAFVEAYVRSGSAVEAYREAFDVSPHAKPNTVRTNAYHLAHAPHVRNAIRRLQDAAAQGTVISVRTRMAWLQRIAEADPGELVALAGCNCRYCWGVGNGYQHRDAAELAKALDKHLQGKGSVPRPDASGGFGYRGDRPPNPECAKCDGQGLTSTVYTPTADLSPAGRALFKGVRQKANGEIEVLMHDQLQAAEMLNKMQSAYVTTNLNANVNFNVPPLKEMNRDDALSFLQSIRPAQ
jgi:phage terminase small subunit